MTETKLYLDQEGLLALWEKLNLRDQEIFTKILANKAAIDLLNSTAENGEDAPLGSVQRTVVDEIAKMLDEAPDNLDSLKEIADWIANHPNDVAEINKAIQDNKEAIKELKELLEVQQEGNSLRLDKIEEEYEELAKEHEELLVKLPEVYEQIKYDFTGLLEGTRVYNNGKEYRIMFPNDTDWKKQNSNTTSENYDANNYYFALRAYAPNDSIIGFKESTDETIKPQKISKFVAEDFAGIDDYGRKYSIVWLPAAKFNNETNSWSYHGAASQDGKYIGWYYTVEWYDENGVVSSDTIRINLTNEKCHNEILPFYMNKYAKLTDINEAVESIPLDFINDLEWTTKFED